MKILDHDSRSGLTRREALWMLGAGVGAGIAVDWAAGPDLLAGSLVQIQAGKRKLKVPRDAVIRTVLNDIDPNTIDGATLMHEHLGSGRPGRGGRAATAPSQDEAWMVEELIAAKENSAEGCCSGIARDFDTCSDVWDLEQLPAFRGGTTDGGFDKR